MSAVRITAFRTIGRARNVLSTAFAVAGFLSASALFFAYRLEAAEGSGLSASVLWASSVAMVLPALVALLAMDVWSEERLSGRIEGLLSLAVRERDYVIGKFFGVLAVTTGALLLSLLGTAGTLFLLAPRALDGSGFVGFLMALAPLSVQSVLWCAVCVTLSAMFRHAATVACAALLLTVVLPRGVWAGLMRWSSTERSVFGEFPLDEHIVDIASGILPVGTVLAYFVLAGAALFIASKLVASSRLTGRRALGLRFSTGVTVLLAMAVVVLAVPLLQKVNPTVDFSVPGTISLSQRTRSIITESSGSVSVTCFLPRDDVRFRTVGRLLRRLQREAESLGGARIALRFVDPRWDLGAAERLVRNGVTGECLVFEKGRRRVILPFDEDCGERACASAIRQISSPLQRRNVYWTVGHGESSFDSYDAFGMSDIARELYGEGFHNESIDLATAQQIPGDCALILIAGAKDDFSRVEIGRLDSYLRGGGRLLVLVGSASSGGATSLLPSWGIRLSDVRIKDAKTLSGSDVLVSDFADHPIAAPLKGSRIVLERPVSFSPSAVVGKGSGADSIAFRSVARADSSVVVASVERGCGAGNDVALRPTRIVVIGDPGFVLNGSLAARASANRDFFSNCVAYLSGAESHGSGEDGAGVLQSGLDREGRLRHVLYSSGAFPAFAFLVLAAVAIRRRTRI